MQIELNPAVEKMLADYREDLKKNNPMASEASPTFICNAILAVELTKLEKKRKKK